MSEMVGNDLWYRGKELMDAQQELLLQKLQGVIIKEQGEIAYILSSLEENSQHYHELQKEQEGLLANPRDPERAQDIENQIAHIHATQSALLATLRPLFDDLFDQIANETPGGMGYNNALRDSVRYDMIQISRKEGTQMEGSRDLYRDTFFSGQRKKKRTKGAEEKEKTIWIPKDHRLLTEKTYPQLQDLLWTHIDKTVDTYKQKILKDEESPIQMRGLINHYFLFIFLQALVKSQVIINIRKHQPNKLFETIIDDMLTLLRERKGIDHSLSVADIKKKFFSTIDENSIPLEMMYKNAIDEDLRDREDYLDTYCLRPRNTSVDTIRREVMKDRRENIEKIERMRELINPAYHTAKDKKEKLLVTIAILEKHQSEDTLIAELLSQLRQTLKKAESDMESSVVFEDKPRRSRDLESLIKIQQRYLKRYQVPVQYWKMFGMVINRLNNYYQIKASLYKKAQKHNHDALERLINSDQNLEEILQYIHSLVTKKEFDMLFEKKRTEKQKAKQERVQSICTDERKTIDRTVKKTIADHQLTLDF